jgi:hypothetical protein
MHSWAGTGFLRVPVAVQRFSDEVSAGTEGDTVLATLRKYARARQANLVAHLSTVVGTELRARILRGRMQIFDESGLHLALPGSPVPSSHGIARVSTPRS